MDDRAALRGGEFVVVMAGLMAPFEEPHALIALFDATQTQAIPLLHHTSVDCCRLTQTLTVCTSLDKDENTWGT